ncbi:MAG: branched-chain amino acid ABC transporter permease [marine bacterium B5-7]|nr:MAG: branched-chain amino acid ABC transporter permease [marine bacterium B5-7]
MKRLAHARTGSLLVLALVMVLLPLLLDNPYRYDIVIRIGINAIVCVGLNLFVGYAGQISLGHAGFFALGAYGSAILTSQYSWPSLVALPVSALVVGVLAFVVARPILRLKGHYLAMGTLGMGVIIFLVITHETSLTGGPDGMPVPPLSIAGIDVYDEKTWYWIIAGVLLLNVWLALNLVGSPIGRALRAIHGSEPAASVLGINVARYKAMVFVISAVIASVAGSLFTHYSGFITPSEAGFLHSVELITMVVLGGMASTYGALVGAVILTALPQFLAVLHDYEMVVFGAVLMGTMIFMPKGIVPSIIDLLRRRRSS